MKFSIIEVISIIAITQSLLLTLFLITLKNSKTQSNKILSMIHIIFAIMITCALFLTRSVSSIDYLKIIIVNHQFALIMGPLIFLYINSILNQDFYLKIRDIVHFIPFILVIFFLLQAY